MAKSFSSAEAKYLINEHQKIIRNLASASNMLKEYAFEIEDNADDLRDREVKEALRKMPIEDINRGKRGFRIKALKDAGIKNFADLKDMTWNELGNVYGISESSAYEIKELSEDIEEQVKKGIKLRISEDVKMKEATRLLSSILKYRSVKPIAEKCKEIISAVGLQVNNAIDDLMVGTSFFRWIFASAARKQQAENAYRYLKQLIDGEYAENVNRIVDELSEVEDSYSGKDAWTAFSRNSIVFFNTLEEVNPEILGEDDQIYGLPEYLAEEIQDETIYSEGLKCNLRHYQEWGVKYALHQKNILLGDEMGLGKTIQAIAVMVSLRNTGASHFVVVCPASVLTNWCREIKLHSDLEVYQVHGNNRDSTFNNWISHGGVAVTTYETTKCFELEESFDVELLVVDEAHYIKNPRAQRTVNVKKLCTHAERLMFMTGTALENRVDEMIVLLKFLDPSIARAANRMSAISTAPQFRETIAPVYYRRKRDDVLTELPELTEVPEWCDLLPDEESVYEHAVLERRYHDARRVSWNVSNLKKSSKANRLLEIVEEAESEDRKVIVFSFFLDTLSKVAALLEDRCIGVINGSVTPHKRQVLIDEFDKAKGGTVLVSQIQSGGTGLNIQSASVVILCEPQFKPSTENQAISRAYRMGQTRNVLVYRLLCENTVDERIMNTLENKQSIFDAFADDSSAAQDSFELDEKTFGSIMEEERERIAEKVKEN